MVWGGIMGNRKTYLVVVQGNINAQRYVADMQNAKCYGLNILNRTHIWHRVYKYKYT